MGAEAQHVIIAGASYAGLAAGLQLGRRAVMIDQHDIGAVQRSACAMPVSVVERFNARDAIIQQYDIAYFHDPYGVGTFPLVAPYCIIDHRRFCLLLWEQSEASFVKDRIREFDGTDVVTTGGRYAARYFIDATGWRGVLSAGGRSASARGLKVTVAVEADVPGEGEGLHFYVLPSVVPRGYGWIFPAGDELRIGVGSYDRAFDVKAGLSRFLAYLGLEGKPVRGGMIPWFSGEPVVGNVLAAGDAAGHCLPLTAEGIRLALGYGCEAGDALRQVVDGTMTIEEAVNSYRAASAINRRSIDALRLAQHLIGRVPSRGVHLFSRGLARQSIMPRFLRRYGSLGSHTSRAV